MTTVQSKKRGFTLIELLIVITIIGILATFVIASFSSAQQKARDGRRKSDLDAIKKAVELSKGDSTGGAYYPGCSTGTACTPQAGASGLIPDPTGTYIKTIPQDPSYTLSANGYSYNPGATGANAATAYTLSACLENANDTGGNTTASAGFSRACPANARIYFVTNP